MLRTFIDSTGVEWRVWSVIPNANVAAFSAETISGNSLKNTAFANGWLCFECDREKRRLAPIPQTWEFDEPAQLEELCGRAIQVAPRRTDARSA